MKRQGDGGCNAQIWLWCFIGRAAFTWLSLINERKIKLWLLVCYASYQHARNISILCCFQWGWKYILTHTDLSSKAFLLVINKHQLFKHGGVRCWQSINMGLCSAWNFVQLQSRSLLCERSSKWYLRHCLLEISELLIVSGIWQILSWWHYYFWQFWNEPWPHDIANHI